MMNLAVEQNRIRMQYVDEVVRITNLGVDRGVKVLSNQQKNSDSNAFTNIAAVESFNNFVCDKIQSLNVSCKSRVVSKILLVTIYQLLVLISVTVKYMYGDIRLRLSTDKEWIFKLVCLVTLSWLRVIIISIMTDINYGNSSIVICTNLL
jgi:hypothetical protein